MFKQIKRKLVADKKLKNYTLYAIGETLLIVIGILVAMNINNWNENKKSLKQSKYFIDEIAVDLQRDTSYLNMALKRIDLKVEYKGKLLYPDSLQNFSTINIQHIISSGTNNININTPDIIHSRNLNNYKYSNITDMDVNDINDVDNSININGLTPNLDSYNKNNKYNMPQG